LIARYHIGTSDHWSGATIFWQIDKRGNIRSGKIMLYNPNTGRRVKEPINHITWVHKVLKLKDFELQQCLFGEHLLKLYPDMSVGIVESEKTAVVASVYLPQFIWLAVGSCNDLNEAKCRPLEGRKVFLFPDLNGFEKWNVKSRELSLKIPGSRFVISDLLEKQGTEAERSQGLDLADYLVRCDRQLFKNGEQTRTTAIENLTDYQFDLYEERAAILEYDAGFPRVVAEQQALELVVLMASNQRSA
jgi:hypothetical protein